MCVHVSIESKAKERMEPRGSRRRLPKTPNAKGSEAVADYVYLQAVKAMSSLFLLGGVPAWPPVSQPGSQMTALILLGSAPNQHFAH